LFWGIALIALVRIFRSKETDAQSAPLLGRDLVKVALFALGVRLLMVLAGFVILWSNLERFPTMAELFLRFDGRGDINHYLNIARHGYAWEEDGKNLLLVFFPLYGYLIRLLALTGIGYAAAAYAISIICYIAGMCVLYRLIRLDFSNTAAWWAVILVSLAPPAFFFGVPMTESLMLLTSALTLYFIRTHRWAAAGICGALCMFTRMAGLVLVFAALAEFITHYKLFELIKTSKWRETFRLAFTKGAWILLMLAGGGVYLFINRHISGDPFRFLYYQKTHWFNETQYFGKTLIAQFRGIANYPNPSAAATIFVPNLLAFTLTTASLVYAAAKRLPVVYIVYTLGYTFVSFAPSWLLSGPRYMLACVPLFIFLGHFAGKGRARGIVLLALFAAGLFVMMRAFMLYGAVY
jgi:Gpi18-like mannosyltransferase